VYNSFLAYKDQQMDVHEFSRKIIQQSKVFFLQQLQLSSQMLLRTKQKRFHEKDAFSA